MSLLALLFGPFPKDLAEPTAAFLMSSSMVLAGAVVAPRWRLAVAVVLGTLGALPVVLLLKMSIVTVSAGAVAAIIFVAFWFHPGRARSSTRWVMMAAGIGGFACLGLIALRYLDWPAQPDGLPPELREALGVEGTRAVTFYAYDLGGFIDREWLWRIDAKPDLVAQVISSFELRRAGAVPPAFWRMAPHYWPRSMPAGAEAFQSPWFSADGRGRDGAHYFLLYDKMHERAFVWYKNNF